MFYLLKHSNHHSFHVYELTHTNHLIIIKYVKNLFNIFCHGLNHIIYILNNSIFIIHQYYVHTPPPYHQYIYVNVIYKINIHIKKLKTIIIIIIIIDNNFINNHNDNNHTSRICFIFGGFIW